MQIKVELVGFLSSTGLPGGYLGGPVEVKPGSSLSDLLQAIGTPAPVQYLIVRNNQLLVMDDILVDGDLIKIIPPIGGG
jgi:sulfur carrier protein ThiS